MRDLLLTPRFSSLHLIVLLVANNLGYIVARMFL